jgi:hypothetical protein
MIRGNDGITSIAVAPDEVRWLRESVLADTAPREQFSAPRQPTGARVTVEFARSAPLMSNTVIRLCYDIAENGGLRVVVGIPLLTHTTAHEGDSGRSYHYRMSHWIAAPAVMRLTASAMSVSPD